MWNTHHGDVSVTQTNIHTSLWSYSSVFTCTETRYLYLSDPPPHTHTVPPWPRPAGPDAAVMTHILKLADIQLSYAAE